MSKIDSMEVNVSEVLAHERITGGFVNELRTVVERKLAAQGARGAGVSVTDDELQSAFDVWRAAQRLHRAEDTNNWLKETGLSLEDVESYLETTILVSKFKDKLTRECDIRKYLEHPRTRELVRELVYADWLRQALTE